ncbi:MAG: hypothetical protein HY696_06775 [Deltaproteobacteria bacterium]|nr:hypothetical protein [Deltaproteobacteria bacterium]
MNPATRYHKEVRTGGMRKFWFILGLCGLLASVAGCKAVVTEPDGGTTLGGSDSELGGAGATGTDQENTDDGGEVVPTGGTPTPIPIELPGASEYDRSTFDATTME